MKSVPYVLGFVSLCFFGAASVTVPPNEKKIDNFAYDIQQFDNDNFDRNTVQWDYKTVDTIQLFSGACTNDQFTPAKQGFSQIRMIFPTSEYEGILRNKKDFNFILNVTCSDNTFVERWWQPTTEGKQLNDSMAYTRMTIDAHQCASSLISQVAILSAPTGTNGNIIRYGEAGGVRNLPFGTQPCSSINNFKTVYWPLIPVQ